MLKYLKRKEELVYLAIWLMVLVFPIVTSTLHPGYGNASGHQVMWHEVFYVWRFVATFFVCFLIHNLFVAPQLVYRNRHISYLLESLGLLLVFFTMQCVFSEQFHHKEPHHPRMERTGGRPALHGEFGPEGMAEAQFDMPGPPPDRSLCDTASAVKAPPHGREMRERRMPHPLMFLPRRGELLSFLVMALLFGLNIGVKYFFKSEDEHKHILELERKSLEQQVKYLKYQINPHFFMNTLNNIHALIDIDPEQAQYTVLVLSRMMRYVLYDGERQLIPLRKELDFIQSYVELMRIRYTKHVNILFHTDDDMPDCMVPPLLLITFVENAFKHGVSSASESFIHINVSYDDEAQRVCLDCANSVSAKHTAQEHAGGVGLKNAIERMQLIYGKDYDYVVDDRADSYVMHLKLPKNPKTDKTIQKPNL